MATRIFRGKNVTVKVIDRGWNQIKREVVDLDNSYVKVGVLSSAGTTRSPATITRARPSKTGKGAKAIAMAHLAAIHEHGAPRSNIPSRPFMKQAYDQNRQKLDSAKKRLLSAIYSLSMTAEQGLSKLGLLHVAQIQRQFVKGSFTPLKPATVKRKGSSKPLIDTGALRRSVDHEVVMR
jgi:phage gpG-like protein